MKKYILLVIAIGTSQSDVFAETHTAVFAPILAALTKAEQTFLKGGEWEAVNEEQETFFSKYWPHKSELEKLLPEEMKSIASKDVSKINSFLKDNGFTIQLKPFQDEFSFGVASIFDILLKWTKKGTKTMLIYNDQNYPAVRMKKGFSVHEHDGHYIAAVSAKNGDTVYMTLADKPRQSFALLQHVNQLRGAVKNGSSAYFDELLFPMVDIDQKPDIRWLLNLKNQAKTNSYYIRQALQETRFQMNEEGAAAQSAVAMEFATEGSAMIPQEPRILKIDKPFYLWIERPGMKMPLFTAYIDTTTWKAPTHLGGPTRAAK